MFNSTRLLIESVQGRLIATYRRSYGTLKREYEEIISWAASMALENIATGDGLYHDVEHTILVTLVGQDILHGKHLREGGITPEDWLHFTISHLCHDIGYVKGVCRGDRDGHYSTGVDGGCVELPEGATCAALTPYHVDRGKCFIDERFGGHSLIDAETDQEKHRTHPLPRSLQRRPSGDDAYSGPAASLRPDRAAWRSPLHQQDPGAVLGIRGNGNQQTPGL